MLFPARQLDSYKSFLSWCHSCTSSISLPIIIESFTLQVKSISSPLSIKHIEFAIKLLGDINDDDILNILDIVELIQIILNDQGFNEQGDINFDGGNNILAIIDLIALII